MTESRPSVTAQGVALLRAAHQIIDSPIVFDDPVALKIVGYAAALELQTNAKNLPSPPQIRAFVVARSQYTEDQLSIAVEQGVCQYVILGAGLDTFAYRNPYPKLHVFEVDSPATQAWKSERLKEASISIPTSVTFVPLDFNHQTLADGLRTAGHNPNLPTFFSFLGVSYYLTYEGLMSTLQFIVSCKGSGVVFDYAIPVKSLPLVNQVEYEFFLNRLSKIGEPWLTFLTPEELSNALGNMGFEYIENLTSDDINNRYYKNRDDGLQVGNSTYLVSAHCNLKEKREVI